MLWLVSTSIITILKYRWRPPTYGTVAHLLRRMQSRLPQCTLSYCLVSSLYNRSERLSNSIYDRGCARTIPDHVMKVTDRESAQISNRIQSVTTVIDCLFDTCAPPPPPPPAQANATHFQINVKQDKLCLIAYIHITYNKFNVYVQIQNICTRDPHLQELIHVPTHDIRRICRNKLLLVDIRDWVSTGGRYNGLGPQTGRNMWQAGNDHRDYSSEVTPHQCSTKHHHWGQVGKL